MVSSNFFFFFWGGRRDILVPSATSLKMNRGAENEIGVGSGGVLSMCMQVILYPYSSSWVQHLIQSARRRVIFRDWTITWLRPAKMLLPDYTWVKIGTARVMPNDSGQGFNSDRLIRSPHYLGGSRSLMVVMKSSQSRSTKLKTPWKFAPRC